MADTLSQIRGVIRLPKDLQNIILFYVWTEDELECIWVVGHGNIQYGLIHNGLFYADPLYHLTATFAEYARNFIRSSDHRNLSIGCLRCGRPGIVENWTLQRAYIRHIPEPGFMELRFLDINFVKYSQIPFWEYCDSEGCPQLSTPPWEEGDPYYDELKRVVHYSASRERFNDHIHYGYLVSIEGREQVQQKIRRRRKERKALKRALLPPF